MTFFQPLSEISIHIGFLVEAPHDTKVLDFLKHVEFFLDSGEIIIIWGFVVIHEMDDDRGVLKGNHKSHI